MSNEARCAHLIVKHKPRENGDGSKSSRWICLDCGHPFWPQMQVESSTQQAPEPRMAIENMRCPNCGESVWSHGERCQPRDVQRKATASDALRSAVQEWEAPNTQFKGKRTRFMFEPRDIWIGVFWDTDKQYVYFFPIPMLGVRYYYGH